MMEIYDYKKDSIFISKALEKKSEVRKILREVNNKNGKGLKSSDYDYIQEWSDDFIKKIKMDFYDFIQDADGWLLAEQISSISELSAPDVIHLASAIRGFLQKKCDYFITNDSLLKTEGTRILQDLRIDEKFEILTLSEVRKKFFPRKQNIVSAE